MVKVQRIITSILILLLVSLNAARSEDQSKQLNVGFIAGLSGQYARISHLMLCGAELSVDEFNISNSGSGYSLKLVAEDDGLLDSKLTLNAVNKFRTVDHVVGILSWAYSSGQIIKSGLGKSKTPVIFFWDSNSKMASLGDNYYGTGPSSKSAVEIIAKYIKSSGATSATILALADEWAENTTIETKSIFDREELSYTIQDSISVDTTDFKSLILKLRNKKPKNILFFGYGTALISFLQQIHPVLPDTKIYIIGQPESDLKLVGAAANGIYVVNGWVTGELGTKLAKKCEKDSLISNGDFTPVDMAYAAYGYQAADILGLAVKNLIKSDLPINEQNLNKALRTVDYNIGLGRVQPGAINEMKERLLIWANGEFITSK